MLSGLPASLLMKKIGRKYGFIFGTIIGLIGATSQNPSFQINSALLSRSLIYQLNVLSEESLKKIIIRAEKLSQNNTNV